MTIWDSMTNNEESKRVNFAKDYQSPQARWLAGASERNAKEEARIQQQNEENAEKFRKSVWDTQSKNATEHIEKHTQYPDYVNDRTNDAIREQAYNIAEQDRKSLVPTEHISKHTDIPRQVDKNTLIAHNRDSFENSEYAKKPADSYDNIQKIRTEDINRHVEEAARNRATSEAATKHIAEHTQYPQIVADEKSNWLTQEEYAKYLAEQHNANSARGFTPPSSESDAMSLQETMNTHNANGFDPKVSAERAAISAGTMGAIGTAKATAAGALTAAKTVVAPLATALGVPATAIVAAGGAAAVLGTAGILKSISNHINADDSEIAKIKGKIKRDPKFKKGTKSSRKVMRAINKKYGHSVVGMDINVLGAIKQLEQEKYLKPLKIKDDGFLKWIISGLTKKTTFSEKNEINFSEMNDRLSRLINYDDTYEPISKDIPVITVGGQDRYDKDGGVIPGVTYANPEDQAKADKLLEDQWTKYLKDRAAAREAKAIETYRTDNAENAKSAVEAREEINRQVAEKRAALDEKYRDIEAEEARALSREGNADAVLRRIASEKEQQTQEASRLDDAIKQRDIEFRNRPENTVPVSSADDAMNEARNANSANAEGFTPPSSESEAMRLQETMNTDNAKGFDPASIAATSGISAAVFKLISGLSTIAASITAPIVAGAIATGAGLALAGKKISNAINIDEDRINNIYKAIKKNKSYKNGTKTTRRVMKELNKIYGDTKIGMDINVLGAIKKLEKEGYLTPVKINNDGFWKWAVSGFTKTANFSTTDDLNTYVMSKRVNL